MVGLTAPAASEISVRIQHHPERADLPRRLVAHLGAFEDVEVIHDPSPAGPLDAWRAHRACLEAMPESASHLLVLQDDALPVPNFAMHLCIAVEQHGESVLCAFTPGFGYLRQQVWKAKADFLSQNAASAKASPDYLSYTPLLVGAFVPCVAIVYPRAFVDDMLAWVDSRATERQRRQLRGADDGVIAMYCRHRRIQPLLMVPSIVEHDAALPSIGKAHRRIGPHRVAALL